MGEDSTAIASAAIVSLVAFTATLPTTSIRTPPSGSRLLMPGIWQLRGNARCGLCELLKLVIPIIRNGGYKTGNSRRN
jgi:hypothetical protein